MVMVEVQRGETAMQLVKLAGCEGGTCPAIFATDRGTLVVQGAIVTDAPLDVPAGEALVEIPVSLLKGLQ
jgi:hypothetical protein